MSIKPSVVYIKGVHSTTGSDQTSDIGFPNIGLDKLFEGTILKEYTGDYDPSKEYVYKSTTSNVAIENKDHFNCIKNGYNSIADGIDHYYTLNNNNYIYNTADTSAWAGKWALSNAINGKELYSISSEADRIRIGDNYYEKNVNDYIKQDILTYNTYNNILQVSWNESNKYTSKGDLDENFNMVTVWKTDNGTIALSGYYLSVDEQSDGTYIVQLLNLTFNNGVLSNSVTADKLYKLSGNFNFQDNKAYYIKNNNNFEELKVNQGQCTFTTDPTTDNNFYIYQKGADWSYPNIEGPEYFILAGTDSVYKSTYNSNNFPLYIRASVDPISKKPYTSYTIYEKTAVKVNYYYSNDTNSLQFVFTDKTIPDVLKACGLPDNIGLEKYIHLTNLKYNKN